MAFWGRLAMGIGLWTLAAMVFGFVVAAALGLGDDDREP
jgi:hypothetical protein